MQNMIRPLIGGLIGAAVGFAMYRFVGCKTGACPMTANPWIAMAIFGFIGATVASSR